MQVEEHGINNYPTPNYDCGGFAYKSNTSECPYGLILYICTIDGNLVFHGPPQSLSLRLQNSFIVRKALSTPDIVRICLVTDKNQEIFAS